MILLKKLLLKCSFFETLRIIFLHHLYSRATSKNIFKVEESRHNFFEMTILKKKNQIHSSNFLYLIKKMLKGYTANIII